MADAPLEVELPEQSVELIKDPIPEPAVAAAEPPPEGVHRDAEPLAVCLAPDVCLTPVGSMLVPVPYQVWGKAEDAQNFSTSVYFRGTPAMRFNSVFSKTYGDEPAKDKGGVKSGERGGKVEPKSHSPTVNIQGSPAMRKGDRVTLNGGNTPGEIVLSRDRSAAAPPQGGSAQSQPSEDDRGWLRKGWDAVGEWVAEHPRTMGAIQAGGGILEAVGSAGFILGGAAAEGTVVGIPAGVAMQVPGWAGLVNAADNAWTGARQVWYGAPQMTGGQQLAGAAAGAMGASPETVQTVQTVTGMGQAVLGGVAGMGGVKTAGTVAKQTGRAAATTAEGANAAKAGKAVGEGLEAQASKVAGNTGGGLRISKNSYEYEIDQLGRTKQARGKLKLKKSLRDNNVQRSAGGQDRLSTDQGGHLVGSRFEGSSEIFNTVAQNQNLNQGAWKAMENSWAKALSQGKEVLVDIRPQYVGESLRPDQFIVNYTIDGEQFQRVFQNVSGQKF